MEVNKRMGVDSVITTHCLDFFSTYCQAKDVKIISSEGSISRNELMLNTGDYTEKYIREEHNILKIFKAGGLKWKSTNT